MTATPDGFNAGTTRTLDAARTAARERATAIGRSVGIYEHIGGSSPKRGRVAATGQFLYRDIADAEGRELGVPKFFYREVERVDP